MGARARQEWSGSDARTRNRAASSAARVWRWVFAYECLWRICSRGALIIILHITTYLHACIHNCACTHARQEWSGSDARARNRAASSAARVWRCVFAYECLLSICSQGALTHNCILACMHTRSPDLPLHNGACAGQISWRPPMHAAPPHTPLVTAMQSHRSPSSLGRPAQPWGVSHSPQNPTMSRTPPTFSMFPPLEALYLNTPTVFLQSHRPTKQPWSPATLWSVRWSANPAIDVLTNMLRGSQGHK